MAHFLYRICIIFVVQLQGHVCDKKGHGAFMMSLPTKMLGFSSESEQSPCIV